MLIPSRKFPFWQTQNKFQWFWKVKSKKKKKKKVISSVCNFSPFHFKFSTFDFPSFSSPYSFFFLASLFLVGQQKFPGEKCRQGGTLPPAQTPPPRLLCHCTVYPYSYSNLHKLQRTKLYETCVVSQMNLDVYMHPARTHDICFHIERERKKPVILFIKFVSIYGTLQVFSFSLKVVRLAKSMI